MDLAEWCAADPAARVAAALPQLLDALGFLHERGIVHCDVKPSNVLVDRQGVVKLLDFGVLADMSAPAGFGSVAGSFGYLAPERIQGAPATPATDAYALGCTLFQVATGRRVFSGSSAAVIAAHLSAQPPMPTATKPGLPPWLDTVCEGLLAKTPEARLTLVAARSLLPGAEKTRPRIEKTVLGRQALLQQLIRHFEAGARPLVLEGPSGIGKTTLLDELALDGARRGLLVLRGASRATVRIPYDALDGVVDDLAVALPTLGERVDRSTLRAAAEAFPVLAGPGASAQLAREKVRSALFGPEVARAPNRREVFAALTSLLDHASAGRPALLLVDDIQWADADALSLLEHLVDHGGPRVHIVLARRTDAGHDGAAAWLDKLGVGLRVLVPPLATHDLEALVRRVGHDLDAATVAQIAGESEGRPFLAEVAARGRARGIGGSLEALLADASRGEADLIGLVAIADGWTEVALLAAALGRPRMDIEPILEALEQDGLLRRAGTAASGIVEVYHDRVRAAVLDRLDDPARVRLHRLLAEQLTSRGGVDHRVVRHLLRAGQVEEATLHATSLAAAAEDKRAFSLAADLHGVVLESTPEDDARRMRRARALERCGRYAEAASEWGRLAAVARGERQLDLRVHEACALLAASEVAAGFERLDETFGVRPRGPSLKQSLTDLLAVGRFVLGPRGRGPRLAAPSEDASRARRDLQIGVLLAFLDPLSGLRFLQRARRDLARAGAQAQVAGCDFLLAVLANVASASPREVFLAERYRRAGREASRGVELPPEIRGLEPFLEGLAAKRQGHWRQAQTGFEAARQIFEEAEGQTELNMARSWQMMTAAHAQDLGEARRHRDWFRRHETELGGVIISTQIAVVDAYLHLLEGKLGESFDIASCAAERLPEAGGAAQRAALQLYRHASAIYHDDPRPARREFSAGMKAARAHRFLSSLYAATYAGTWALLEVNALRAGDPEASRRRVEQLICVLDRSAPLWAGLADRLRAYLSDERGEPERALWHLERAEERARAFGRSVDVSIAEWQRGVRLGGEEGDGFCRRATSHVESLGVSPLVLREDASRR